MRRPDHLRTPRTRSGFVSAGRISLKFNATSIMREHPVFLNGQHDGLAALTLHGRQALDLRLSEGLRPPQDQPIDEAVLI